MRLLSTAAMAAALTITLSGPGRPAVATDVRSNIRLTVSSYGSSYQECQDQAYFQPFMAKYPHIRIVQDTSASNAKLRAMVATGNVTLDLMIADDSFGLANHAQWLEPIDYSVIDRAKFIAGAAGDYRVVADVEGTVLAFNTRRFGERQPQGYADLFDVKTFPGSRALWKFAPSGIFEAALLADGVAPENLYPLDVERALRKLDTIKDDIIWWDTGSQAEQLLASGEAVMGLVWIGRAVNVRDKGIAIDWTQWTSLAGHWVVPKGAKNRAAAMTAIDFFTEPAQQGAFAECVPYGPSNQHAVLQAAARTPFRGSLPTDHLATRVLVDADWWAAHGEAVSLQFHDWLLQ